MSEVVIAPADVGAYEIAIAAGSTTVVVVTPGTRTNRVPAVIVHQATTPVYVRAGTAVVAKDPKSTMIPPQNWSTIETDGDGKVAITATADAVVSVYRS